MGLSDDARQLAADRRLLKRIDDHGVDLRPNEVAFLESFMRWTETKPLTPAQRAVAERIDEERVR